MIKRIRFATRAPGLSPDAFLDSWRDAVGQVVDAPVEVRPTRAALCHTLPDAVGTDVKHDGVGLEWFSDADHLARYDAWLDTDDGRALTSAIHDVLVPDASPLILADERVMRGADWLEQRWRAGGDKFKHMAVALRATGLSPAEFSELWKSRAGQVRRAGDEKATVIPDVARGLAYVQNHPRPRSTGEWAYDAVNEVYFDDLAGLRLRVDWFRDNLDGTEDDLVRENWFLVVREEVLFDST